MCRKSQLKKALPSAIQVSSELPVTSETDAFRFPLKVLQCRLKPHDDRLITEVLIQWSCWPPSMATWELEDELKLQFPAAPAWGQAGFQGGKNVRKMKPSTLRQGGVKHDRKVGDEEASSNGPHDEEDGPGVVRPKQAHMPNTEYIGPDWV
jgi:hypothetical protein